MARFTKTTLAILSAAIFVAAQATAAPLGVSNASFEDNDPFATANAWSDAIPVGWNSQDGTAGTADPTHTIGANNKLFIEDIADIGGTPGPGGGISYLGIRTDGYVYQDLGVPWQVDTTYTVDVQASRRGGAINVGDFGLWDSGSLGGSALGTAGSVTNENFVTPDTFFPVSTLTSSEGSVSTFTTGSAVPVGNVVVYLRATTGNLPYDNVSVDASPVPEPSGLALIFPLMLGLAFATRRRRS